ncbi:MAG: acetate--CoA ligase family protein [Deltaproteobacteria bacterium]
MTNSPAEKPGMPNDLRAIFRPRSVAVIGAGRDPTTISGRLFRNLLESFRGPVYPVNPKADEICSIRTFPTVLDIPAPVDLAFIAVPAAHSLAAVRQCIEKKVRGLVVITAGFSETGEAGKRLERELLELVRAAGIRTIGPNCFGVFNTDPAVQLQGTFAPSAVACGNVGICTQSGALGVVIPDYLRHWNLGASTFASIGNKADVSENDLLDYWRNDPATAVVALYLESFRDAGEFRRRAGEFTPHKPIVALKAARTRVGARAASSHTAALAGPDRAAEALFRQAGVVRVDQLQELFGVTALLANQPLPRGRSVAIVTNAGGPGILCADALAAHGLMLPEFTLELQTELRRFVRPEASVRNPVDLVATIDAGEFRQCLELLMDSREIDAVVTIYVPREPGTSGEVARAVREVTAARGSAKTSLAVFMQTEGVPAELADATTRIPGYQYPEAAAGALAHAVTYAERRARPVGRIVEFPEIRRDACRRIVDGALTWSGPTNGWLHTREVQELLVAIGLRLPRWKIAASADEAVAVADEWETPVVVKVVSPTVLHKTEVGGVAVNVAGADAVRRAFQKVTLAVPEAKSALVQEFIPGGHETFIGVSRDRQFGHLVAFGCGGTAVELLDDVACRLHPLSDVDAGEMIHGLRTTPLLTGYRGQPAADLTALKETLLRVSALLTIAPEIAEIDLNPVKVFPAGNGVCVLDARIRVGCFGP